MSAVMKPSNTDCAENFQNLHAKLEQLATHHYTALKDEQVLSIVEKLVALLERCEEGSSAAERKLYSEGFTMLGVVKDKIKLALEEELRIVDESPTVASNAKGRKADRYNEAERHANDALVALEQLAEQKPH